MEITDKAGEVRLVDNVYPDGSWNCPFCWSAVVSPSIECANPACTASKWVTPEMAVTMKAKAAAIQAESDARKRNHECAMKRISEENASRQSAFNEGMANVRENGQCETCFAKTGKAIKHRSECPRTRPNVYRELGMKKVHGALGGTYYE